MIKVIIATLAIFMSGVSYSGDILTGDGYLFFRGEVVEGDVEKMEEALRGSVSPVVFLNSGGGSVGVGLELMALLKSYGATTVVDSMDRCASICSAMWLGGSKRIVRDGGQLGVHQPYLMANDAITLTQYEYANSTMNSVAYMMYMVEKNEIDIDPIYWILLLKTFAGEMYIFNREELHYLEIKE